LVFALLEVFKFLISFLSFALFSFINNISFFCNGSNEISSHMAVKSEEAKLIIEKYKKERRV